MSDKNILIVEGEQDKRFINEFIKREDLNFSLKVLVATAKDFDSNNSNSKQGAMRTLETLAKQLDDGTYNRLGIIVDMDYPNGEKKPVQQFTFEQIKKALLTTGFETLSSALQHTGTFFSNPDFENNIGVWVMPNNIDEGYLEVWIEKVIKAECRSHYQTVERFIASFDNNQFKINNLTKAKVYTWLATQPKPSQDSCIALNHSLNLVDTNSTLYQNFKAWLIATFN